MKTLREKYFVHINDDKVAAAKDMQSANEYIKNSTATFTRGILSMMAIPKMHTEESFSIIKTALETTHNILDKIIECYLADSQLQALFPFDERLKKLILLPKQYNQNLPICRLDIFFNEDDYSFKFCEFNADGASAMNEDREIYNAFKNSRLYQKMGEEYHIESFELFDSWVSEFLTLYKEYSQNKNTHQKSIDHQDKHNQQENNSNPQSSITPNPTIAIVDFLDIGTKSEFKVFRDAFIRCGLNCTIEDITTLKYDGKNLTTDEGVIIDAIYRRAVTSECMDKYETIQPFINAVMDGNVCLVGAFRTQIIHDKNLFRLLRHPYIKQILTNEENNFIESHIPKTYLLNHGEYDKIAVLNDKNNWIIKPSDRYGSFDVHTGGDYQDIDWYNLIKEYENKGFVLQEYCPPFRTQDTYFQDDTQICDNYGYMTGIFLYNGKVKGLYTRCMLNRTTTQKDEGRVTTTLLLTPKNTTLLSKN